MLKLLPFLLFVVWRGHVLAQVFTSEPILQQGCPGEIRTLYPDHTKVIINGTRVTIHPQMHDSDQYDDRVAVVFQFFDIGERNISNVTAGCRSASDPIMDSLQMWNCPCKMAELHEVGSGHEERGYSFNFTGCRPNKPFTASLSITIPNVTWSESFDHTLPGSNVESFNWTHPGGGIKFGLKVKDWEWNYPTFHSNFSYLYGTFLMGFYSELPVHLSGSNTQTTTSFQVQLGPYPIVTTWEAGIILDGHPSLNFKPYHHKELDLPNTGGVLLWTDFRISFCQPVSMEGYTKWNEYIYDPTITYLWSLPIQSSPSAPSTDSKQQINTWVVAVAVSVPLIFAIVIGLALASHFIPSWRKIIRPFTQRHTDAGQSDEAHSSSSAQSPSMWVTSTKPTII